MGILNNIFDKIFRRDKAAQPQVTQATQSAQTARPAGQQSASPAAQPAAARPAAPPPVAPMDQVDVEAMLNQMAKSAGEPLNWRTSIVDLMKLLDIDHSLASRKELAQELNYKGDMNDSATMNIWLHRQVMTRLAANGGKVPADLRD
ncbi:MAG TPA: DUF3597 domain-containing protein [Telluria sp.]|nr:DUF3597 domain-containing protein [Telluria sp.]